MQNAISVDQLQDATVYTSDGDKIGSVGQVYLDDATNEPSFVTVRTGLFGTKETFVPLTQASTSENGLTVPYDKDFVKGAPNVDADGSLTPEEEQRIYEYYSMDYAGAGTGTTRDADTTQTAGVAGGAGVGQTRDTQTRDTQIPDTRTGTDEASVVARDEQLNAHTERRESGQFRLRKHTHQNTETVSVPVSREEVVVDREPVDPNSPEARNASGDEEVVVTTHEDVPVVDKTVTAEKVSVDKNTVQGTEQVSGEVSHDEVEVETDRKTGTGEGGGKGRRSR